MKSQVAKKGKNQADEEWSKGLESRRSQLEATNAKPAAAEPDSQRREQEATNIKSGTERLPITHNGHDS